jgi:hypothetical protein
VTAEATARPTTDRYHLTLTCPACGALMRPVADGRPMESGRTISAIAECSGDCRTQVKRWQIMVRMVPFHEKELHP